VDTREASGQSYLEGAARRDREDYHRSSSKLGRFGKVVGIDLEDGGYLVMLDNFECLAAPMRRVEWRKVAT